MKGFPSASEGQKRRSKMFGKILVAHLFSTIARFRLTLILASCLLASVTAAVLVHSSPAALSPPSLLSPSSLIATAIPAAAENACVAPGLTVVTDPAGDQTAGVTGATASHDIIAISVAEQYPGAVGQLVITMKVASLSSTPPPNTNWRTFFTATHAD